MVDDIESLDDIYVSLEEERRLRERTHNPHTTPSQTALDILAGALGVKDSPPKSIPIHHLPGDNDTTLLDDPTIVPSDRMRNVQNTQPHHERSSSRYNDRGRDRDRIEAHTSTPRKSTKMKDSIRSLSKSKHTSTRRVLEELNLQLEIHDTVPSIPHLQREREKDRVPYTRPETQQHPHGIPIPIPIPTSTPFPTSSLPYSRTRTYTTTGRSTDSISTMLAVTSERLAQETKRANEAEKQASEVLRLLKEVVEGKSKLEREVRGLRDERELWRVRLEEGQAEIFRAQNVVAQIDKQRVDAEGEAKRLRDKLRKVYEERAVENARDEGRQAGFEEGLKQGRMLGIVSSKGREREEEERERRRREMEERRLREEEELKKQEEQEEREREKEQTRRKEEQDKKKREQAERIARERLEKKTDSIKDTVKHLRPRRASTTHNSHHHPPSLPAPPSQPNLKPSFPAPITIPQPTLISPPASQYPNPLPRLPIPTTPSSPHITYIPIRGAGSQRKSTAQRESIQLRDTAYPIITPTPSNREQPGVYKNPRLRDEEDQERRERERIRGADRERRYAVVGVSSSAAWGSPIQTETETERGRDTMFGNSTRFSELAMLASPRSERRLDQAYSQKLVYGRPSTRDRETDEEAETMRTQWRVTNGSPTMYGNPVASRRMNLDHPVESPKPVIKVTRSPSTQPREVVLPVPLMNTLMGANFAPTQAPHQYQQQQQQRNHPLQFTVQPGRSPRIGGLQALHASSYSPNTHQRQELGVEDHDRVIHLDGPRKRLERSGSSVSVPGIQVETPSSHGEGMHLDHAPIAMDPVMLTPEMHSSPLPTTQEVDDHPHPHQPHQDPELYTPQTVPSHLTHLNPHHHHHLHPYQNNHLRLNTHVEPDDGRDVKLLTGVVHDGHFPPGFVPLSPIPLFGEEGEVRGGGSG